MGWGAPWNTRVLLMQATVLASLIAAPMSWDTISMVIPCSAFSRRNIELSSSWPAESTPFPVHSAPRPDSH